MSNDLLEAALGYAARGWPVFPCRADKTPAIPSDEGGQGCLDATTDPEQIRKWWERFPKANIGLHVGAANMMVVDDDPGANETDLVASFGHLPETLLRARTPRGGRHRYYALAEREIVQNSASKVSKNVDIRSFHGYVLLPPSRTADGAYVWESEGKPAYRTDDMVRVCNIAREKDANRDTWLIEPDLPENVEACSGWLRHKAKPAIMGSGGDHCALATAAMCKSYGISEALALDLMWEHWNPRCDPPWSAEEADHLETKVRNAYRYNTSPPGNMTEAYKLAKARELFKPVKVDLPSGNERHKGRFRIVDRAGMNHIKPPTWLIPDLLPAGGYGMLFGPRGTFKTFIALDLALSVAAGFPMNGTWAVGDSGPVLYAAGEGRSNMLKRVRAWEAAHWNGQEVEGFHLIDPVPKITEPLEPFVELAQELHPSFKLLVLDTVGRSMQGVNENAQENASSFTAMVEALQRTFQCAVLAIHHTGHDTGSKHARGSSVFEADTDTVIRLARAGKGLAVSLEMTKQKDAPEWEEPKHLQLTESLDSLTVVPVAEQPKASAAAPSAGVAGAAHSTRELFMAKTRDQILDEVVKETLAGNRSVDWSHSALAEAMAMHPRVDVGSSQIRTHLLKPLRERKDTYANRAYDPMKKRYRYVADN